MIGITKGEEQEKGAEDLSEEIIAENFLNWERKEKSRFRRHRETPIKPTQRGLHQDAK